MGTIDTSVSSSPVRDRHRRAAVVDRVDEGSRGDLTVLVHPGIRPGSLALGLPRTSSTEARVEASQEGQLATIAELACADGVISRAEADLLIEIGAKPLDPASGIGEYGRDPQTGAHFSRLTVGGLAIQMYMGTAAERDEAFVAVYQRYLTAALAQSGAQRLYASEPKRLWRTVNDDENVLTKQMRKARVREVVFATERVDLTSEVGWNRLAELQQKAAEDRDFLVRKLTESRARQEAQRDRWARPQAPPPGYRFVGNRQIEVDLEVREVALRHVLPALEEGVAIMEARRLLREFRVVGPKRSGTGAWRVLEPHEPYPDGYLPDVRAFCRGIDAWISGVFEAKESCPLNAEEYLRETVVRTGDGRAYVITKFRVGALDLSPAEIDMARAVQRRLETPQKIKPRMRRSPYSGMTYPGADGQWRLRAFREESGERRYAVHDHAGKRVGVINADFETTLADRVATAVAAGALASRVDARAVPLEWRRWLSDGSRDIQTLSDAVETLREQVEYAVERSTKAATATLRDKYGREADALGARLDALEHRLSELQISVPKEEDWRIESDLVPRALATLAHGTSHDDHTFPPLIQTLLPISVVPDAPGLMRISAALHAPTNRGIAAFEPIVVTVPDLKSQYLGTPGEVEGRALRAACDWLEATEDADLRDFAGPLVETGRAARHWMTSALATHMPKSAASWIMLHPVHASRTAVARAIRQRVFAVGTTLTDFERRICETYVEGSFGRMPQRGFLIETADARALETLVLEHSGTASTMELRSSLERRGARPNTARQRVDEAIGRGVIDVHRGEGRVRSVSVRQCACGGAFTLYVAAPEVAAGLLCSACLSDPTGMQFPAQYAELTGDCTHLLDERREDVVERRAAVRGASSGQAARARARVYGFEVADQGRPPKAITAEVVRLDGLVERLLAITHGQGGAAPEQLSEAWRRAADQARSLPPSLDSSDLERLLNYGTAADWRRRARLVGLDTPARGTISMPLRLAIVIAEGSRAGLDAAP
ncbi:hypothetical protein GON03_05855 [Nocardioides sp. MAH-18]|uniref:Uncharacterized protein n=1 Tax=Nocardioides agri TaxID=2682843 RepID=A0A6L6XN62_9ACTN|nr:MULTISPECIES: hypothetical protein [unclassified Nocardioides]MBA2953834.1 hypothetical protein [Nocardioides sp. CGMCC 1.13656]MVQ48699.1 hypothetical protein [Nocardioides sp. MAH-18]